MLLLQQLAPYICVGVLVVVLPGYIISRILGASRFQSIALGSIVSVAIYAAAGILLHLLGIDYNRISVLVTTGIVIAVFALYEFIASKVAKQHLRQPSRPGDAAWWWGTATASLVAITQFVRIIPHAGSFNQTSDNIYHMNAVMWILDTGNASSLALDVTNPEGAFYPSAWHDTVAAIALFTDVYGISESINAMLFVMLTIIWPFGMMLFLRTIIGTANITTTMGIGILITAFPFMPLRFFGVGVLYAFVFGMICVPALWAVTLSLLRVGAGTRASLTKRNLVILIITLIGATCLAHPSAFVVYMIPVILIFLARVVQTACYRKLDKRQVAVALISIFFGAIIWLLVRPDFPGWDPPTTVARALGELIFVAPQSQRMQWVPALLTITGFVYIWRRGRYLWLTLSTIVFAIIFIVGASIRHPFLRTLIIGIWYSDPERTAGLLHFAAIPLAAIGWHVFITRIRRYKFPISKPLISSALLVLLTFTTQFTPYMKDTIDIVRGRYELRWNSPLVDTAEYMLLNRLPEYVPADSTVAVNPWNGSAMAYPLSQRDVTVRHLYYDLDDDLYAVNTRLNQVAENPELCEILQENDIEFVLDFGSKNVVPERDPSVASYDFSGFEDLEDAEGFELVEQSGTAKLYKITACD